MLDESYLDLDFVKQPQYVQGDLGPPPANIFADYEETLGNIPRADWKEIIEEMEARSSGPEYYIKWIYNQGNVGSCTSHATCQAMVSTAVRQFGHRRAVILSPISLYKRVARSPNSGSAIKDNVDVAMAEGVLPADIEENRRFPHRMPSADWGARFPDNWQETASLFRLGEVYICRNVDAVISALLRGHFVIVGRQGHAICYVRPTYSHRGELVAVYANSWGKWGFGFGDFQYGFGADSESLIARASQWAVAVRTVEYREESLLEDAQAA